MSLVSKSAGQGELRERLLARGQRRERTARAHFSPVTRGRKSEHHPEAAAHGRCGESHRRGPARNERVRLRAQRSGQQVGPVLVQRGQFHGRVEERGRRGGIGLGYSRQRVGVRDVHSNRERSALRQWKIQNVGTVAADDVEVPVERPVDERVAGTYASPSLVAGLDVASREHDGDITARVTMSALEGAGREIIASIPGVGKRDPVHFALGASRQVQMVAWSIVSVN